MKASELRINNWVYYMNEHNPVEISGIDRKQIHADGDWDYIYEHKPIPLTEEWLTRFGFELPAHSWIGDKFHLSEYGKGSKHPNGGVWVVAMNNNNAIISEIQYVHQLQNLYFALTGEELTIKE